MFVDTGCFIRLIGCCRPASVGWWRHFQPGFDVFVVFLTESLILAQDERWRRA